MSNLLAGLMISCCLVTWAQRESPAVDASFGARVFRRHCESCHGKGGHGGRAPDLSAAVSAAGDGDAQLEAIIAKGVPGTEMESYGERLKPDEITGILTYLHSASASPFEARGDAAKGETLFWGKGGCGACHAVEGRGNRVGPDLSRIGRRRSADYLRTSLVKPSADIASGYSGVTIVTREGRMIRGVEKALDDFSVVLQDFTGKVYSFGREDLRSVTADAESLMPAYGDAFTPAEMNDLLKYLSSLGQAGVHR
jgi:putative heme-binding domain-containing protein